MENIWMASDFNGAFAQIVTAPIPEIVPVECVWSNADLATIPCAYATAETMRHLAGCSASDDVLVTVASGGVGCSAVIQLAKRRGARVTALTSRSKLDAVRVLGTNRVVTRDDDLIAVLGAGSVDLVVDNVAGEGFPVLLRLLRRGGR
jgi:NADPH:quinone reductase-like Zn-dependent oxidoreductase